MTDQQTPPTEAAFFTTIRGWGITRGDSRMLGGVVSGLTQRLGWSALGWTRVGVVAAALLLNGIVLLAYAAAWALLPDRQGRIIAQDFGRGAPNVGALIAIGVVAVFGMIGLDDSWGPWGASPWGAWPVDGAGEPARTALGVIATVLAVLIPLAIVGGVIALIVVLSRRNGGGAGGRPGPDAQAPDATPPVYAAPPAWAAERQRQRAASADSAPQASAGWTAPQAGAPAPSAVPVAAPPRPRPPRVPGPGAPFGLLTLAWLVISAAGAAWAGWRDTLTVHPLIAWFALFVTGLGVIIALVALAGRRLGFLGFLSAMLLIPTGVMIAQADSVVDGWSDRWLPHLEVVRDGDDVVRVEIGDGDIVIGDPVPSTEATAVEETPTEPGFDALAAFDGDYARIALPGGCSAIDAAPAGDGESRGLVSQVPLADDATATVTAQFTTVRVESDAGLVVALSAGQSASVHWPDRGVACEASDTAPLSLVNPGEPVLTLDVESAEGHSTIVIEEVSR